MSLKIEGRMKSPEYVAMVVSDYRWHLMQSGTGNQVDTKNASRDLFLHLIAVYQGYLFENATPL